MTVPSHGGKHVRWCRAGTGWNHGETIPIGHDQPGEVVFRTGSRPVSRRRCARSISPAPRPAIRVGESRLRGELGRAPPRASLDPSGDHARIHPVAVYVGQERPSGPQTCSFGAVRRSWRRHSSLSRAVWQTHDDRGCEGDLPEPPRPCRSIHDFPPSLSRQRLEPRRLRGRQANPCPCVAPRMPVRRRGMLRTTRPSPPINAAFRAIVPSRHGQRSILPVRRWIEHVGGRWCRA